MKTLVMAKHEVGKFANGHDGCHGRWAEEGNCPGEALAAWLNALGEDHELFGHTRQTCGQVRDNYLRSHGHVVAVEPAVASLAAEERRLFAALRIVRKQLRNARALRDSLEGHPRCEYREHNGKSERRCVRDAGHPEGMHECGSWYLAE